MHHFARRTAGAIAVLAVVTALGAGCSKDDDKNSASTSTTTAAAPAGDDTHAAETKMATRDGAEIAVAGGILDKYNQMGGATGALGMPTGPAMDGPGGGMVQEFDGGGIYFSSAHGTHVVWGEIRKAWDDQGGAGGTLGYPTSDEYDITGGKQSDFSGGSITWVDNETTVTEK
ncbi:esterase [Nocardia sp. NPDC004860]|uniref:LGFP repeat-containing protein n=1 Tax=Nocardia sp. NPDC004860 TaxID=3154557 RepID=UPI00339DF04B